jgi:hypothetical protein
MEKKIKIFKSFEEQEKHHLQLLLESTVADRFRSLYKMQQWTKLFHPATDNTRKIIIHKNGHSER